MRALTFFTPASQKGGLRAIGVILAVVSVVLPVFPLGPLAAHPWMPMAVLWAAYGWAIEAEDAERVNALRGLRAPAALAALGLLHDQLAGGPVGLYMTLYLAAFLIGWLVARTINGPNLGSLWAGFAAMCIGLCGVASLLAPWALGGAFKLAPFAQACMVTTALFPLVRALYMDTGTGLR